MQSSDMAVPSQPGDSPGLGALPRVTLELRILDSSLDAEAPRAVVSGGDVSADAEAVQRDRPAVLVVAPDLDMRRYLQEHLSMRLGVNVLAVADAAAARALLTMHVPQLLLLDAAASELLRDVPHTPAVLLDDAFPPEDLPAGVARRLLPWPFEVGTLVRTVEGMLG